VETTETTTITKSQQFEVGVSVTNSAGIAMKGLSAGIETTFLVGASFSTELQESKTTGFNKEYHGGFSFQNHSWNLNSSRSVLVEPLLLFFRAIAQHIAQSNGCDNTVNRKDCCQTIANIEGHVGGAIQAFRTVCGLQATFRRRIVAYWMIE